MAYSHPPAESGLRNLHNAMELNAIGQPVIRVTSSTASSAESAVTDGFGRQRVSQPYTLFDSQLRYTKRDDLWAEDFTGLTTSGAYITAESAMNLSVGTDSGARYTRETKRVFAYQPGKSFQILTTFVMSEGEPGVTQRVGLFNEENGIFFANIDGVNCIVKRSSSSGSLVDTVVPQTQWNVDTLNGNNVSGISLDTTKAQIFFTDLEWLGVGEVRCGFVIDGAFYFAHVFSHANNAETTYMTTACLPLRYEIENTGATTTAHTLKQICATVISEGGYALRGRKHSAYISTNATRTLDNDQEWPVISIRLNSGRLDCVSVLKAVSVMVGAAGNYTFKLVKGGDLTDANFLPAEAGSNVEVDTSATAIANGQVVASRVVSFSNQSQENLDLGGGDLFDFQLERDGLSGTAEAYTIVVIGSPNSFASAASMDWEEIF